MVPAYKKIFLVEELTNCTACKVDATVTDLLWSQSLAVNRSVLLTRNMISGQISQPSLTEYAILRLWISVLKKVSHSDCVGVQIMKSRRLLLIAAWLHKVRSVLSCRNLKIILSLTFLRDIKNRLFPARKVSRGISNALLHPLSYVTLPYFLLFSVEVN